MPSLERDCPAPRTIDSGVVKCAPSIMIAMSTVLSATASWPCSALLAEKVKRPLLFLFSALQALIAMRELVRPLGVGSEMWTWRK